MTIQYRTEGFVFKNEDRFEADRTFSVFTRDFGRVEVFGKAIRKIASKLRGGMEIFSFTELEFIQGKNKKTLVDAASKNRFNNLVKDPNKLLLAFKISEVMDNFIRGEEKDEKLFDLLSETFEKLNDFQLQASSFQLPYFYFFWNFVSLLGYGPELSRCAMCQQNVSPESIYFSNQEGGLVCHRCHELKKEGDRVDSDAIKVLRLMLHKNWDVLSKLKIGNEAKASLEKISNNYHHYLLQRYE